MADYRKTDIYLRRQAANKIWMQHLAENSDTDVSPAKDDNWIDGYFINLTSRVVNQRKQIISSRSEIKEPSIDLDSPLKMFLQEAVCDADNWTDVNCMYDDKRSFPAFLMEIAPSGLDKYASNEDNDISIGYQSNTWSFSEASPDDVDEYLKLMNLPQRIRKESDRSLKLMLMKPSQTHAMVTTDDNYCALEKLKLLHYGEFLLHDVCIADEFFRGSLWLKTLLQRVYSESDDDFRQEQARLLDSFLDHLIRIQEEQRFVASSFSVHLEHLRKSDVDRYTCPLIFPKHPKDTYIWRQKHIFDSLCTMSRESVFLFF
ncbi:uncharacterized protein LOC113286714 [Papaver somniferum]|uniref:uncharacterized protein LOC113286714 n=1 Tax=Papaver somniferum TaxID=3469 RepID=UPI000E6F506C|nr:uncharacterized protein LOC113286714 [Papaver somniferum]XP_026391096.1 uncharacterized protein LOC113286714 [Papaver somniferum]